MQLLPVVERDRRHHHALHLRALRTYHILGAVLSVPTEAHTSEGLGLTSNGRG